jgi:hydroxymethylbilane synthase
MTELVRIATRRSALAMWQAHHVRDLLVEHYPGINVELVPIVTRGDIILDRPLAEIGGKGLFLKELEHSMLEQESDLAVHSMKDMPAEMAPGLSLEVSLPRANPFDAWLCNSGATLQELPGGSRVGTSSLRRQCLLATLRPDLEVVPLRGNVDTRLAKLHKGEYDAIILACAGLERLGLAEHITQVLEAPQWLPAVTQGIIGLQCRSDDEAVKQLIAPLADAAASVQSRAERVVAAMLEGSCQVPLGVYASLSGDRVQVDAMVGQPDGSELLRATGEGLQSDAEQVARRVANELLDSGAKAIIEGLRANA